MTELERIASGASKELQFNPRSLIMRETILVVGLCISLTAPLQAQESEAKAIVDKGMKAHGDEKVAQKLMAATGKAKGTVYIMDMPFNMKVQSWLHLPAKTKTVIALSGDGFNLDIVEIVNGDKGWISVDGNVMDLDDDQMKEAKDSMHVERVTSLFGIKADKEMKLAALGETKVGDKAVVGVAVTKKGQRDVKLYFDKATNMLAKAEYRAVDPISKEEVTQEKLFGGYKELVPGFKSATNFTVKNDGKLFMELEITEIRPVDRHDDSTFAKPK
jgi:hypothetical protein